MPLLRKADRLIDEHDRPACGPARTEWLTPPGTLTQFGAAIETLPPGSRSSIKHWHAEEDELVLALEGKVTLIDGDERHVLYPGDAATFRAGVPIGHCLENVATQPCRYLVVGTRATQEVATYPDHNRIAIMRAESDETIWTDLEGALADNPYRRAYDDRD